MSCSQNKSGLYFARFVLRDDEEEDGGGKAAPRKNHGSMLSYVNGSAAGKPATTHRFFTERRLRNLDTL